jgi:hypothetical protein
MARGRPLHQAGEIELWRGHIRDAIDAPMSTTCVQIERLLRASSAARAIRSASAASRMCGKSIVNSSPASRGEQRLGKAARLALALGDGTQAIGDDAQHLIALGVAEIVVHFLEAVEIDEQKRQPLVGLAGPEHPVRLALEVNAVGQAGDRIIERHRADIVERRADLFEEALDRIGERGQLAADDGGRGRGQIARADGEKAVDEGAEARACALLGRS